MSTVAVNGEPHPHRPGMTVASLLTDHGLARPDVAVALDGHVVHREAWESTPVRPAAQVEVLAPMQGG